MKTLLIFTVLSLISLTSLAPPCEQSLNRNERNGSSSEANLNVDLNAFLDKLAYEETGDTSWYPKNGFNSPWHVINNIGALGRWQLLIPTLRYLGYKGTIKDFLNSKELQKEYVIKLIKKNKEHIEFYIPNYHYYIGKYKCGVKITLSGMIAASHLAGVGGLKLFLIYGTNSSDGNESVKGYMDKFKYYDI